jgi:peptidoglycan/LPS O-acetylase OafA/YrhL/glycosyltransferase involved in cell wall biosynthesis
MSSLADATKSPRFVFIDALRGFAALAILFHHLLHSTVLERPLREVLPQFIQYGFGKGALAVEVFFVISGFVIAYSLRRTAPTAGNVGKFIVRRQLRLDPPYWTAILFVIALQLVERVVLKFDRHLWSPGEVIANAFYLHEILHLEPPVLDVAWTLCLEIQFYLAFIIALYLFESLHRRSERVGLPMVMALFASGVASLIYSPGHEKDLAWLFPYWCHFAAGALCCWAVTRRMHVGFLISFFAIYSAWLAISPTLHLLSGFITVTTIAAVGFGGKLTSWLAAKPFQFFGTISYSLYLLHLPILLAIMRAGYKVTGDNPWAALGWMLFAFAACVAAAWVFHLLIERPSMNLASRFSRRPAAPPFPPLAPGQLSIAMYASAFHPHMGGVEEVCRQLTLALKQAGHRVIILTNQWPRDLPEYEQYQGIDIYRLPFRVPEGSLKAKLNYHLTHRRIERRMLAILDAHRVNVLHVQCVSSNGHYAMIARRERKLPLVMTAHGEITMDANGIYQKSAFQNQVLRELAMSADLVSGCSERTVRDVEKHLGHTFGPRRAVILNGAPVEEIQSATPYAHARPYILCMGRLVPQKGFATMIDAFALAGVVDVDLLIAGDGPERDALQARIHAVGLQDRIKLLGRADRQRVSSLLVGAEFFVLPSVADEGLPLVGIEAMAAGRAIIASDVGGIPEYVRHGETGILVPKGDVEALAAAIRHLYEDRATRHQMEAAAKRQSASFSWPHIAAQCVAHYRAIIEARDGAPQLRPISPAPARPEAVTT